MTTKELAAAGRTVALGALAIYSYSAHDPLKTVQAAWVCGECHEGATGSWGHCDATGPGISCTQDWQSRFCDSYPAHALCNG